MCHFCFVFIMNNIFYPAKLLLFGEHTVLQGSQALAMPLWKYGGSWEYADDKTMQFDLPKFYNYLKQIVKNGEIMLDTEGLAEELNQGLYFKSYVPRGYGVGSSGALVAGMYDKFCIKKSEDLLELKTIFGKMESYFHGASSGFDPLICYVKKPILIKKDRTIVALEPIKNDIQFFLIDTHIQRKAENLITIFADRCKSPQYNDLIINELVPHIDEAIAAFLNNMPDILFETMHKISHFQYRYFPEAVPLAYKNAWLEGLAGDIYKLKLCGAGGGGFILGFCKNLEDAKQTLLISGFNIISLVPLPSKG